MRVEFDKMQGAGNDFILVDNRDGRIADAVKRDLAVRWCRRCFGIGADGLIFVEPDSEYDFRWDFYNAGGSLAEMCGNGARCVARFAERIGAAGRSLTFRSLAGPIQAELTERGARVRLTDARLPAAAETVLVEGNPIQLWFLNTGVPHAVVQMDSPEALAAVDVPVLGRRIRTHPRFAPAGTNVNFFCLGDGNRFSIRTYERGVEDETLACGTGVVATSIVVGHCLGRGTPITAETRGGGELSVRFTVAADQAVDVYLEGGAELVFQGVCDG
ncbi:MAG: diaminopimelate epimerase [Planctomycetes bacterium]|nr:diaminopimelate epimerase [Planctomycetota bacterium]